MKEAMLYEKLDGAEVRCAVCSQRCTIPKGKRGICGVRENQNGTLYALNYGKTIAVSIDPIEKKPLYHFLPGSKIYSFAAVGCNFHCTWCQNWEISQSPKPDKTVSGTYISPEEHVRRTLDYKCPSIAYTYTEPTIFLEYALETMMLAKEKNINNVWVTNGYMTRETLDEIIPYLNAANVDFKGPDDDVYKKFCGGRTEQIMENLKYLHNAGVHNEITTLIVPGVNDKKEQLEEIAEFIAEELSTHVPWHVSRFFPGWKMLDNYPTPLDTMKMAYDIGKKAGLKFVHMGNV
jgi:pyruvate formate lyase activating enzyme